MPALATPPAVVLRRADLLALGLRPRTITRAVQEGRLIRLRRDRYVAVPTDGVDTAVRVGGRLACVSLLRSVGVFVSETTRTHVHVERTMTRLRSPHDRRRPWSRTDHDVVRLHWSALRTDAPSLAAVGIDDALAQAVRCQAPRFAVATVDSVLHLGRMTPDEVDEVFSWLPPRYRAVRRLADGTAESGTETLTRLLLRQLGLRFEAQKHIPGVGRVDFLVEGWLIVECDSKQFHEGWERQRHDRRRDLAAASRGYTTLRLLAEDILFAPDAVLDALRALGRRRPR